MATADKDGDPTNPHDLAVDVQTDLQKLATMLAHAGAAPQAVAQLTHMAEIIGQVVKILGSGPALPGAAPEAQQGPPPEQAQPQQPPQPAAPQPAQPSSQQQAQAHSIHAAAHSLHAAMQQSAAQRRV